MSGNGLLEGIESQMIPKGDFELVLAKLLEVYKVRFKIMLYIPS